MNGLLMRSLFCFLLAGLLGLAAPANAGQSCEEPTITPDKFAKSMQLAEMTRNELDRSGAEVVILARNGQDLSRYGVRYSHMAFAWRDQPQGRWLVVHELNECASPSSDLYVEGLGNFFLDVFRFETRVFIPSPENQHRLATVLASTMPKQLHWPQYNMLAFPFSQKYQNSNQWLLEVYAAANGSDVDSRSRAQAWLTLAAYQPRTIQLSAMTRLGASLTRANVSFDDHPFDRRMDGKIDTVTADSVFRFLHQHDPAGRNVSFNITSAWRP